MKVITLDVIVDEDEVGAWLNGTRLIGAAKTESGYWQALGTDTYRGGGWESLSDALQGSFDSCSARAQLVQAVQSAIEAERVRMRSEGSATARLEAAIERFERAAEKLAESLDGRKP